LADQGATSSNFSFFVPQSSSSGNFMRHVINPQLELGELDIGSIRLDPKSRDDIPSVLRGLQHIYTEPHLRNRVFSILSEMVPSRGPGLGKADSGNGRPGMAQWRILVLGVMRLALDADYDRLHELANQHRTLRLMLGHGEWDTDEYKVQTLKDNLMLFTPDILDRINQEVVKAGHVLVKKKGEDGLSLRCDSFVVQTHVHFPTDINLLWDAMRKTIEIVSGLCRDHGLSDWRQSAYNLRQLKRLFRHAQKAKHSTSKDTSRQLARQEAMREAHRHYLEGACRQLDRARATRARLAGIMPLDILQMMQLAGKLEELDTFMAHAARQIDQVRRRVLEGQSIPHDEKVFSLFQPHTEWISKGKAGVPVELGLRVCVVEDQHGFILHHQVMRKLTDDAIAISIVEQTRRRFGALDSVSMDKGFHSPANQEGLKDLANMVVLPRKGRLSAADKAREGAAEFVRLRHRHSAVESAINALEVHGLQRCRDHGIVGFERYVALAVTARNVLHLGAIIRRQEAERELRKRGPYKKAA
jgi:hypothetical protein